jgi:hypothetical protein
MVSNRFDWQATSRNFSGVKTLTIAQASEYHDGKCLPDDR